MDRMLDRSCTLNGVDYKIVEVLNSNTLLVVKKDDFEKGIFPLRTYIIPGE